jgi:hypothetical protein
MACHECILKEAPMRASQALTEFKQFLQLKGKSIAQLAADEAVDIMITYYTEIRADDCALEDDGDMLLSNGEYMIGSIIIHPSSTTSHDN